MKLGCEKCGTSVMNTEECVLFLEVATNNGSDIKEAFSDMKMIDAMFVAVRNHILIGKTHQKTKNGYFRKGTDIYTTFEKIIEGRTAGAF
jgi:hypothetical protein